MPVVPPLSVVHAALSYDGPGRELVARLKYRNHRGSLPWLASAMAAELPPSAVASCIITWAPTTDARRRQRGFDHAELLATQVAAALDRPAVRLLRRRAGAPQTGLTLAARRSNSPRFAPCGHVRSCVVVVDDVVTTGTTLAAAAAALLEAGASSVIGLVAAATPLKHAPD